MIHKYQKFNESYNNLHPKELEFFNLINQRDDDKNINIHDYAHYLVYFLQEVNLKTYFDDITIEKINKYIESEKYKKALKTITNIEFLEHFQSYLEVEMLDDEVGYDYRGISVNIFSHPKIIERSWMVHLTIEEYANEIEKNGFLYGATDIEKLAATKRQYKEENNKKVKGYNFAYILKDFFSYAFKYKYSHETKYGRHMILFRSSGVRVWHSYDLEYQTVFWGDNALDVLQIHRSYDMEKNDIFWYCTQNEVIVTPKINNLNKLIIWVSENI